MKRKLFHFFKDRKGAIAIEFAFALPPLLVLIFGVIEAGRAYYIRSNLQHAAFEGQRHAMLNVSATNNEISSVISQKITSVDPQQVTISIVNQTISSKPYKQISIAYNFSPTAGSLINLDNIPINVQSSVPVIP